MAAVIDAPTNRYGSVENTLGVCTQCGADLCTIGDEVACSECNLPQIDHPETVRMKAETEQQKREHRQRLDAKRAAAAPKATVTVSPIPPTALPTPNATSTTKTTARK